MPRTLIAALAVAIALSACSNTSKDAKPEEPTPTAAKDSASKDSAGKDSASKDGATAKSSPVDVTQRCTKNEDCIGVRMMYIDKAKNSCCRGCNTQPVSKSWYPQAGKDCDQMGSEGCPVKKCAGLKPVACVSGKCTVVPKPSR